MPPALGPRPRRGAFAMGDDGQDARCGLRGGGLDPGGSRPAATVARTSTACAHVGEAEIARVRCGAGPLQRAVHPVNARPDQPDSLKGGHGVTPVTVCRTRHQRPFRKLDLERGAGHSERVRAPRPSPRRGKASPVAGPPAQHVLGGPGAPRDRAHAAQADPCVADHPGFQDHGDPG